MGHPVIAGDPEAQRDLNRRGIPVPWTIANDAAQLRSVLKRLVTDAAFFDAEAARVGAYVREYHDYPVVGTRYRDHLLTAVEGRPRVAAD